MPFVRRHRVGLALLGLLLLMGVLVAYRLVLTLMLIPTVYVNLEERFPRQVEAPDAAMALQGDRA